MSSPIPPRPAGASPDFDMGQMQDMHIEASDLQLEANVIQKGGGHVFTHAAGAAPALPDISSRLASVKTKLDAVINKFTQIATNTKPEHLTQSMMEHVGKFDGMRGHERSLALNVFRVALAANPILSGVDRDKTKEAAATNVLSQLEAKNNVLQQAHDKKYEKGDIHEHAAYQGGLTREDAIMELKDKPNGSALLRYSANAQDYVVSYKNSDGKIMHMTLDGEVTKKADLDQLLAQLQEKAKPSAAPPPVARPAAAVVSLNLPEAAAKLPVVAFYKTGATAFMGNFHVAPFKYNGNTFQCAEAAFHHEKYSLLANQPHHEELSTPGSRAFQLLQDLQKADGQKAYDINQELRGIYPDDEEVLKENWDKGQADKAMWDILNAKFNAHPELRSKLNATGNKPLIEHRMKRAQDIYWSDGNDGKGANMLGLMLMAIRDNTGMPKSARDATGKPITDPTSLANNAHAKTFATHEKIH